MRGHRLRRRRDRVSCDRWNDLISIIYRYCHSVVIPNVICHSRRKCICWTRAATWQIARKYKETRLTADQPMRRLKELLRLPIGILSRIVRLLVSRGMRIAPCIRNTHTVPVTSRHLELHSAEGCWLVLTLLTHHNGVYNQVLFRQSWHGRDSSTRWTMFRRPFAGQLTVKQQPDKTYQGKDDQLQFIEWRHTTCRCWDQSSYWVTELKLWKNVFKFEFEKQSTRNSGANIAIDLTWFTPLSSASNYQHIHWSWCKERQYLPYIKSRRDTVQKWGINERESTTWQTVNVRR